jgi:type III restriction enzyme
MDTVVRIINYEFDRIKINGIQYERIAGQVYEMKLFEAAEIEQYLENLICSKKTA